MRQAKFEKKPYFGFLDQFVGQVERVADGGGVHQPGVGRRRDRATRPQISGQLRLCFRHSFLRRLLSARLPPDI